MTSTISKSVLETTLQEEISVNKRYSFMKNAIEHWRNRTRSQIENELLTIVFRSLVEKLRSLVEQKLMHVNHILNMLNMFHDFMMPVNYSVEKRFNIKKILRKIDCSGLWTDTLRSVLESEKRSVIIEFSVWIRMNLPVCWIFYGPRAR